MTDTDTDGAPGTEQRLAPTELRELFLFEALSAEQLQFIADHGWVVTFGPGETVYSEGEPAECFYVLLDGEITLNRLVRGSEVELVRGSHRGSYAGATQAYVESIPDQRYQNSMRTVTSCRLLVIPAKVFAKAVRQWFPMGAHLLEGLFFGLRNSDAVVGQRERLIALGQLSAGLTHELNNPAAAAVRATGALRGTVASMRHKLTAIADKRLSGEAMHALADFLDKAAARIPDAPRLSPLETSDAEDEISDWLSGHGVQEPWDMAATFVQAGLDVAFLDEAVADLDQHSLGKGLLWAWRGLETELLLGEIEEATSRISSLVAASKQYSQLDRAPFQDTDVHEGLDSTLVMLAKRIGSGIRVVKDYDRSLPLLPAYPAELNQVWTNLVDNAVDAMTGEGTLTVRTALDGDRVLVEVADTGPGIPEAVRRQIFEPFFTTKPVGQGTGLGLDISRRIVVDRHGGDLRVESVPGDTRFQVRLPVRRPVA